MEGRSELLYYALLFGILHLAESIFQTHSERKWGGTT